MGRRLFAAGIFILFSLNATYCANPDQGFLLVLNDPVLKTGTSHFVPFDVLQNMPADTVRMGGGGQNEETVWIGVNLFDLINRETGTAPEEIKKIAVSAPDGYMSVLSGQLLTKAGSALCAYRITGEDSFPRRYGKMRLIFSDLRMMYWVNSPERIVLTLTGKKEAGRCFSIYFLNEMDFGSDRIPVNNLLKTYRLPPDHFYVLADDGLSREYNINRVLRYLLLLPEGDGLWNMDGINVPGGLKTKRIFFLSGQDKGIFLKQPDKAEQKIWIREFEKIHFQGNDLSDFVIRTFKKDGNTEVVETGDLMSRGISSLCELLLSVVDSQMDMERIEIQW